MKLTGKLFVAVWFLTLTMVACSPTDAPAPPAAVKVQTSAPAQVELNGAQTPAIQRLRAETQIAPTLPPASSTSTTPLVTVSEATNCWTGPNADYDLIVIFQVGDTAQVVARYSPGKYWIIKYPGGGNSTCWLGGQYATVTGDTSQLPEAIPPPLPPTATPQPVAPNAPTDVKFSCSSVDTSQKVGKTYIPSAQWTVKLTWTDNSKDDDGFYVYKDGSVVANLGPTATSYTDQFNVVVIPSLASPTHTYGIVAFNSVGNSATSSVELTSCP